MMQQNHINMVQHIINKGGDDVQNAEDLNNLVNIVRNGIIRASIVQYLPQYLAGPLMPKTSGLHMRCVTPSMVANR